MSVNMAKNQIVKKMGVRIFVFLAFFIVLLSGFSAHAAETSEGIHGEISIAVTFLEIVIILLVAKVASSLIERYGQPAVLGELLIGIVLGNLHLIGVTIFEPIKYDPNIFFLAQLGVVVLLFQVGLESNLKEMLRVGFRALLVATIGVIAPFVIGTWLVGPWLLPGFSFNTYLFLGATLTATSVGITARVFQDLGKANIPEARIVLGAAVIDDVMGLIVLAIVSAIVTVGIVSGLSIFWIIAKATLFLLGAIIIGQIVAPIFGKWLSKIHQDFGMKFILAISFALVFAFLAEKIGLAPIVGAFAAGLVLDPVHFKYFRQPDISQQIHEILGSNGSGLNSDLSNSLESAATVYSEQHVEHLIRPIGFLLIPVFFVLTGMEVRIETLFDKSVILTALAITVTAFVGKIVAGFGAGKVNKWIVGWGMVPRGEVGLIFAVTGKAMGVVSDGVYSIVVVMITLSTLLTPPVLAFLLKRQK